MFLFGFTCQALVICAHFIKTFNPQWISTLTSGQAQAAGACTCTIAPLPPSDISVTSWANVLWACAPQAPKYALHPTLQPGFFRSILCMERLWKASCGLGRVKEAVFRFICIYAAWLSDIQQLGRASDSAHERVSEAGCRERVSGWTVVNRRVRKRDGRHSAGEL